MRNIIILHNKLVIITQIENKLLIIINQPYVSEMAECTANQQKKGDP